MKQSPSGEANSSSASQEIPRILWTWRFITLKWPPPAPILSHFNPVQASVSHFLIIYFNIKSILPFTPFTSKWSLSLRFFHLSILPYMLHAPLISFFFGHPNNICWAVQIIKLLIMQFSPLPYHLDPLRPKYLPQHPTLEHPPPMFLPRCKRPSFTHIQNNG